MKLLSLVALVCCVAFASASGLSAQCTAEKPCCPGRVICETDQCLAEGEGVCGASPNPCSCNTVLFKDYTVVLDDGAETTVGFTDAPTAASSPTAPPTPSYMADWVDTDPIYSCADRCEEQHRVPVTASPTAAPTTDSPTAAPTTEDEIDFNDLFAQYLAQWSWQSQQAQFNPFYSNNFWRDATVTDDVELKAMFKTGENTGGNRRLLQVGLPSSYQNYFNFNNGGLINNNNNNNNFNQFYSGFQQQQTYTRPTYTQPTYTQPIYPQPIYTQPIYTQPIYTQPIYYGNYFSNYVNPFYSWSREECACDSFCKLLEDCCDDFEDECPDIDSEDTSASPTVAPTMAPTVLSTTFLTITLSSPFVDWGTADEDAFKAAWDAVFPDSPYTEGSLAVTDGSTIIKIDVVSGLSAAQILSTISASQFGKDTIFESTLVKVELTTTVSPTSSPTTPPRTVGPTKSPIPFDAANPDLSRSSAPTAAPVATRADATGAPTALSRPTGAPTTADSVTRAPATATRAPSTATATVTRSPSTATTR